MSFVFVSVISPCLSVSLSLCLAVSPYLLRSTYRSEVVHDLGVVAVQCELKRGGATLREERMRKGEREWERGSEREG